LIQQTAKVLKQTQELELRADDWLIPPKVPEQRYGNAGLEDLSFPRKAYLPKGKTPERELTRLLEDQKKARRDEIFGGFTKLERAAFEARSSRINLLEHQISQSSKKASEANTKAANQRSQWNKQAETDTSQSDARQPYRSRERDSSKASTDSKKKSKAKKTDSDQSPGT